jgi:alpha-L-fucosidase
MFISFGMGTFTNTQQASETSSLSSFAPTSLNIAQWANTAKKMRAKYAVLTARHSGGLCLWNTATTTYNVMNTPVASDIVATFCTEMRAVGVTPCLYILNYDKHFENITNVGFTQADYLAYNQAAITELLSNYGQIGCIWLDGAEWAYGNTTYPWSDATARFNFIHGLQSNCLLVNNSHLPDAPYGLTISDIVEYEKPPGGNGPVVDGNVIVAEECDTAFNDYAGPTATWFWNTAATAAGPKSAASLYAEMQRVNAADATYLLNVCPDTTGKIPAALVSVLSDLGSLISPTRGSLSFLGRM